MKETGTSFPKEESMNNNNDGIRTPFIGSSTKKKINKITAKLLNIQ